MKKAWVTVFDTVREYGVQSGDARRLTNLLLAAVLTADPDDDEDVVEQRARDIAREPRFAIKLGRREWSTLISVAVDAVVTDTTDGVDFDGWVREFQKADPSRKSLGAYATPASFADALAAAAIPSPADASTWHVVDPACGAGALLIACLNRLSPRPGPARRKAALRLHGVELDPAARELACLLIWMAAGAYPGDLAKITSNIRCCNALLHSWQRERAYDVLVMNPPWDSLRHKALDPNNADERDATVSRINEGQPGAAGLPMLYSAQGGGDRNLCKAFIELAPHLLTEQGRMAALIPAAFTSDEGMADLRRLYLNHLALETWTGFENRSKAFDIDSRYKFGIVVGARSIEGTRSIALRAFAVDPKEMTAPHVVLDRHRLSTVGGPVGIIPDITSARELDVLGTMLARGTPFFEDGELGMVRYRREVDLTLGKEKGIFSRLEKRAHSWNEDATMRIGSSGSFVPVLEGRMVGQYDFFQKSWVEGSGRTAVWRANGDDPLDSCRPQYVTRPMDETQHRLAICDVTSATNTRTVHATVVPDGWVCGNTAPVLRFESERAMFAGLAILNSLTFDWLARRMVSGLHLNKFYLSCMAWPELGSHEVGLLADAGRTLTALAPRCPLALDRMKASSTMKLQSTVEAIVAKGFGLNADDLAFMLDGDVDSRRGFWRYYATVPGSQAMAMRASAMLA